MTEADTHPLRSAPGSGENEDVTAQFVKTTRVLRKARRDAELPAKAANKGEAEQARREQRKSRGLWHARSHGAARSGDVERILRWHHHVTVGWARDSVDIQVAE